MSANIILVNLISEAYLQRFQAPLATTLLQGYLQNKMSSLEVIQIDMQKIFEKVNNEDNINSYESYNSTVKKTIDLIINIADKQEITIVGFSMKWKTRDVTKLIIKKIGEKIPENRIIFVLGNIISTFSFKDLLLAPEFKKVLAVVGEGEDALVEIIKKQILATIIQIQTYINIKILTM